MKTRVVAIFLVVVTLLSLLLVGCKEENEESENISGVEQGTESVSPEYETDPVAQGYYADALRFIESGDYKEAYVCLKNCNGYKDSDELLRNFKIVYKKSISTSYMPDGKQVGVSECDYDDNGNPILKVSKSYKHVWEYDEYGNKTLDVLYNESGEIDSKFTYKYQYDENGNVTQRLKYKKDQATVMEKILYVYDENNVLVHEQRYSYDKKTIDWEYTYDENGRVISRGNESGYRRYEYDEDGKLLREWSVSTERTRLDVEYEYDENDNLISVTEYDASDNISVIYKYGYDERGNKTFYATCDSQGQERVREEYDIFGNCIRKIPIDENGVVLGETKIEYPDLTVVYLG